MMYQSAQDFEINKNTNQLRWGMRVFVGVGGGGTDVTIENIDYDVVIYKGDFLFYPYECKDCNSKGNEYYNLIYTESEVDEK